MHRIYCPEDTYHSEAVIATPSELHHLRDVLRLKTKDKVRLFNGKGQEATGAITYLDHHKAIVTIEAVTTIEPSGPVVILACGVPKKGKFETIIEKTTELGVDEIVPILTQRSEVKWSPAKWARKYPRLETVALNAAKQSQRIRLPYLHGMCGFKEALELAGDSSILIASLKKEAQPLLRVLPQKKENGRVTVFIGPEGDFTDDEYALAKEKGAKPISLGSTTLKVETAAIAAVSVIEQFYST